MKCLRCESPLGGSFFDSLQPKKCMIRSRSMATKAIILAAGKGTRLYPVTLETPKPLLTVKRKPILNYLIEMFRTHGVYDIGVVIRPQDEEEFLWWQKRWTGGLHPVDITFFHESEPMGTFGYTAHQLQDWVGNGDFFFTNGDELKEVDLAGLEEMHRRYGAYATIALVEVAHPHEYGVAVLDGDYIVEFLEKPKNPPARFISSGLYCLSPQVFAMVDDRVKQGDTFLMIEKDVFPNLAQNKKLVGFQSQGKWFDCGTPERWQEAIQEWS